MFTGWYNTHDVIGMKCLLIVLVALPSCAFGFYNPSIGRWQTPDPIEEEGGKNLYAFCGNNAVTDADVLGLISPAEIKRKLSRIRELEIRLRGLISRMGNCLRMVNSWRPGGKKDSEANDKYRHCLASCEIAGACGDDLSKVLGLAKELRDISFSLPQNFAGIFSETAEMKIDSMLNGDSFADSLEDLTADALGVDLKNVKGGCACACRQYYQP